MRTRRDFPPRARSRSRKRTESSMSSTTSRNCRLARDRDSSRSGGKRRSTSPGTLSTTSASSRGIPLLLAEAPPPWR